MNPSTILDNYKETKQELAESACRLFEKIHDRGYKGRFDWNAYIEGFHNTGEMDAIVEKLEKMLDCNSISRTQQEAVKPKLFKTMTCKRDKTTLKHRLQLFENQFQDTGPTHQSRPNHS